MKDRWPMNVLNSEAEEGTTLLDRVRPYLPWRAIVVEAGAKTGADTVRLSRAWPRGQIHAFEPVPALFDKTIEVTRDLTNVRHYRQALSERTGAATMFVSSGRSVASSSLLTPKEHLVEHPDTFFESTISVETVTLDDWAAREDVPRVDFLWLDTQGTELAIMRGSPRIMRTVTAIHTEVSLKEMYKGAPLYPEVKAWMKGQGFKVVLEELPWTDMGNVLFARKLKGWPRVRSWGGHLSRALWR